jgi:light-regulated signal transduction histidine kinase (bacteriophytochrome)
MQILIEDILVLTKIHSDPHKREEVDLNKILKQVMDEMQDELRQTQAIIESKRLSLIKGNQNQVFYLFKNLISNAIKFQKPGNVPQLKIISEIVPGNETEIAHAHEEYLKISFTDNGFGFDKRYAKKIFQVFQRLHGKHEFEGTGIGLAICKKIMENHEGAITVESELGKGSTFNCYFPLH